MLKYTVKKGKILLSWLRIENSTTDKEKNLSKSIYDKIREILSSFEELERLKKIAASQTAGIWRIKRAKIILGTLANKSIETLVLEVRVPPESIIKCQESFANEGLKYLEYPDRRPTQRETNVEQILTCLENPPQADSKLWDIITARYIGHDFSVREIQKIRDLISSNPSFKRNEIARNVCKLFNLYQSNGKIKLTQVYQILKRMDMDNLICLPPPIYQRTYKRKKINKSLSSISMNPDEKNFLNQSDIGQLQFIPVQKNEDLCLWQELIKQYHYINISSMFGSQIRYLVYSSKVLPVKRKLFEGCNSDCGITSSPEKYLLAALGFAACAWRISSREEFIGWTDEQRIKNFKLVISNVRFLILPWIKSPNLASRILGGIAKQLPIDWEARYNYRPVLLETFVQLDRFQGTCYRAANWIQIGKTEGYSLYRRYRKNVSVKAILVYPLHKNFRQILCRL